MATGEIPSFHVVFNDIEVDAIKIPPLGVFFFEDELALDYRMGEEWTPPVLAAFARLLHAMAHSLQAPVTGKARRRRS